VERDDKPERAKGFAWQLGYWLVERNAEPERAAEPARQLGYWLNTSSNVRHNSTCQHYRNTKRGRACGPNEGKPCGICGG
jgi:hypothetical protein